MHNRFVILVGALAVQLAIGAVYAWSIFGKALQAPEAMGLTATQAAIPFEVAIGTIVLGTFVGGRLQDARGPRLVAVAGVLLYAVGIIASSFATSAADLWLLVVGYGVVGGLGLGMAYIVPLALLQKWFPRHRALITGVAAAGFGFGAIITSPVAQYLMAQSPAQPTRAFLVLGLAYLVIGGLGAATFVNPPEHAAEATEVAAGASAFTVQQAVRTPQWLLLTVILTVSVTAGISLVSMAASAASDIAGFSATAAAAAVGGLALFNGGGRVLWAWLSDRLGQMTALAWILGLQGAALMALPHAAHPVVFLVLAAVVYTCYGGAFGVLPATAGRFFGLKHAGAIYGLVLLGWSVGGVLGPVVAASIIGSDGNYVAGYTVVGAAAIVGIFATRMSAPTPVVQPTSVPLSR